ncbi:MAG: DUF4292 domain-containing protein [Bacteroidetes bacterium]|nr:DUF4292 domain-containing protein [Bacteroidota bacterium]
MKFKTVVLFMVYVVFSVSGFAQEPPISDADTLIARIAATQFDYQTLSARAKVSWSDGDERTSFQTGIRMKKDSLVWMSLSTAGIEGVRLLIGRDSMRVLNNFSGDMTTHDLSYLQFWLPFPVNFNQLQQFIAGQRMSIGEKAALVTEQDSFWVLHTESNNMRETVWVDKQEYTLRKILLKDKLLNQDMEIIFEAYAALNEKPFSYRRLMTIHHGAAVMQMSIEISRAKRNEELTYPFDK